MIGRGNHESVMPSQDISEARMFRPSHMLERRLSCLPHMYNIIRLLDYTCGPLLWVTLLRDTVVG